MDSREGILRTVQYHSPESCAGFHNFSRIPLMLAFSQFPTPGSSPAPMRKARSQIIPFCMAKKGISYLLTAPAIAPPRNAMTAR